MGLMNLFQDELCWILTNFKSGQINFAEADLEIRQLIGRKFGLVVPRHEKDDIAPPEKWE